MGFRKIFNNTILLMCSRVAYRIFGALAAIIIARYLNVEKFGLYSAALALVNTFLIANDIGSTTLLLREGSRKPETMSLYFGNSIIIQFLASLVFFSLALICGHYLGYSSLSLWLIVLLGSGVMIYEFRKSFNAILRIKLKLKYYSLTESLNGLLILIGTIVVISLLPNKDIGLMAIALVPLFCNTLAIIALYIIDLKYCRPKFACNKIWPMLKEGYVYAIYNIVYTVYFQIGTLMTKAISGDKEAGLYAASSKIVLLIIFIPQIIFQVALPLMFKYSKEDFEKYKRIHRFIFRYLNAFAIPIAIGTWLLAEPYVQLIYAKPGYSPAAEGFRIFSIFLLIRFIGNVSGQSLTTMDKQRDKIFFQVISLIILIISCLILIPKYGFIGAGISTCIAELTLRSYFLWQDFKYLKVSTFSYIKTLLNPLLAGLLMGLFIYFTKSHINTIIITIIACGVYLFGLWLFRFFEAYDFKLFKEIIPNKFKKNYASTDHGRG